MSTDTLERTDLDTIVVTDEDTDAPDEFRHYFAKWDLDRNLLDGVAIKAMCGFIKKGLAHPGNTTQPVCPKCKLIHEGLPDV